MTMTHGFGSHRLLLTLLFGIDVTAITVRSIDWNHVIDTTQLSQIRTEAIALIILVFTSFIRILIAIVYPALCVACCRKRKRRRHHDSDDDDDGDGSEDENEKEEVEYDSD